MSNLGDRLNMNISWDLKSLPVFEKNFYMEHPDVQKMTPTEVDAIRKEHDMTCIGEDIPKPVRNTAVAWAIAQAERAWRKEDSADMSRTMAKLDGELRKMEERAGWIKGFGRRKAKAEDEAAADAAPEQTG